VRERSETFMLVARRKLILETFESLTVRCYLHITSCRASAHTKLDADAGKHDFRNLPADDSWGYKQQTSRQSGEKDKKDGAHSQCGPPGELDDTST
jgi:hypothetical protein